MCCFELYTFQLKSPLTVTGSKNYTNIVFGHNPVCEAPIITYNRLLLLIPTHCILHSSFSRTLEATPSFVSEKMFLHVYATGDKCKRSRLAEVI